MSNNLDRRPEDVLIDAVMEASGMGTDAAYEFDVFRLEIDEQRLLRNGSVVHLAPKEFETLRLLIAHHGRLVSKQMLLDHVWTGTFVGDDAITQRICVLRKALGEHPERARFIETVPKRGYRFVAPVRALKR
jgi:DNA-binding winged helix-turn-helix (wHTH) protein